MNTNTLLFCSFLEYVLLYLDNNVDEGCDHLQIEKVQSASGC